MDAPPVQRHDPAPVTARAPGLPFILLVVLLDMMGIGLLIPVGPALVMKLQGGTEGEAAPFVGALSATFSAMVFLFSPLLGAMSDRYGRRPVLLVSMFGSAVDYLAMALVPTVWWLFATRVVNGLTGASITVASAYIADVTSPQKRAAAFGMFGAMAGLGFVLGPLLGGLLGSRDIHYPFYAAALLTLLNGFYGFFVLPESLPPERRTVHAPRNPFSALVVFARYPVALRLACTLFLVDVAQFALHATWALYTGHRYHWGPVDVGWSMFAVGVGAFIVQAGLVRRVIPLLGETRSVIAGLAVAAVAYVGYAVATEGWMIYVAIGIASLAGIAMPACQALITKSVRADQQGTVQGGLTSARSLANIIGPIIGAAVFAWSIAPGTIGAHPGTVFFVSAGLTVAAIVVALITLRRLPPSPSS